MQLDMFFPNLIDTYAHWYAPRGCAGPLWTGPWTRPQHEQHYIEALMRLGYESIMTTPCVMHLLNSACRCLEAGEIYLEIGSYRGSTLIGALLGNDARAIAVDDRSEPAHADGLDDQVEFDKNIAKFGMRERVESVQTTYQEFYLSPNEFQGPVGVLFLDGFSQSPQETYQMIQGALPLLAKRALIVLDDMNMEKMHTGVYSFVEDHADSARLLLDLRTPELMMTPKYPTWWNGTGVIAWQRR